MARRIEKIIVLCDPLAAVQQADGSIFLNMPIIDNINEDRYDNFLQLIGTFCNKTYDIDWRMSMVGGDEYSSGSVQLYNLKIATLLEIQQLTDFINNREYQIFQEYQGKQVQVNNNLLQNGGNVYIYVMP